MKALVACLLVAAVVKRMGGTELGVTIVGPIHGVLFLVYAAMLLRDYKILESHEYE